MQTKPTTDGPDASRDRARATSNAGHSCLGVRDTRMGGGLLPSPSCLRRLAGEVQFFMPATASLLRSSYTGRPSPGSAKPTDHTCLHVELGKRSGTTNQPGGQSVRPRRPSAHARRARLTDDVTSPMPDPPPRQTRHAKAPTLSRGGRLRGVPTCCQFPLTVRSRWLAAGPLRAGPWPTRGRRGRASSREAPTTSASGRPAPRQPRAAVATDTAAGCGPHGWCRPAAAGTPWRRRGARLMGRTAAWGPDGERRGAAGWRRTPRVARPPARDHGGGRLGGCPAPTGRGSGHRPTAAAAAGTGGGATGRGGGVAHARAPPGPPPATVAARGKPTDRGTKMFVWQQANKSRSVGPSGRATEPKQNAILFANTVDLSRGGTLHVLGSHERNVSDLLATEKPKEVAPIRSLNNQLSTNACSHHQRNPQVG